MEFLSRKIRQAREYVASKGFYGDVEEVYDDEEYIEDEEEDTGASGYSKKSYDDRMTLPPTRTSYSTSSREAKIVDISAKVKMQVVISSPQSLEDAGDICDFVLANKIVSINLEGVDHAVSQRIVDFLSGVAYSLGGAIQSAGNRNFIIAPQSVDITGHLKEELKKSGVLFSAFKAVSK